MKIIGHGALEGKIADTNNFSIGESLLIGRQIGESPLPFDFSNPIMSTQNFIGEEIDTHISRLHALIIKENDGLKLCDLGSASGTYIERGFLIKSIRFFKGEPLELKINNDYLSDEEVDMKELWNNRLKRAKKILIHEGDVAYFGISNLLREVISNDIIDKYNIREEKSYYVSFEKSNSHKSNYQMLGEEFNYSTLKIPKIIKTIENNPIITSLDPYEVLGISPEASKTELRKAYLNRVKIFHNDKIRDDELVSFCDLLTAKLNEAYQVITGQERD